MPHDQPVLPIMTADGHAFDLIHVPSPGAERGLLFLPGMGLSARQYIDFGQALAGRGVEVFIHEWRGIGSSNWRASRQRDWGYAELLDEDLRSAMAALSARNPQRRWLIGGHSLGSQLACLLAAVRPESCSGLLIVAGGSPYWRQFHGWMRWAMPAILFGMPAVARLVGYYPGRSLGFAGREARGVIDDWTASGRSGCYQPRGLNFDFESAMATLAAPTLALRMQDDWFVPETSLDWLLAKLGRSAITRQGIDAQGLGGPADHYRWMREPEGSARLIAEWITAKDKPGYAVSARAAASSRA